MTITGPIGLVDIGSNSVVLIVARPDPLGWQVLERVKCSARLGACIDRAGALTPEGIKRLRTALSDFVARARLWNARLRVTATASLRNVSNGESIAAALGADLGCTIDILSDADEATAAFVGVWDAEQQPDGSLVVVDVGGGSAEVGWGACGAIQGWFSLPMGGVRLSTLQAGADPINAMRAAVADQLNGLEVTAPSSPVAFACSGSIRRLCTLAGLENHVLTVVDLDRLVDRLEQARWRRERLAMPGMDKDRVDVLLPAAILHQALAQRFGWDAYQLSLGGLRWGLLYGALRAD